MKEYLCYQYSLQEIARRIYYKYIQIISKYISNVVEIYFINSKQIFRIYAKYIPNLFNINSLYITYISHVYYVHYI